jgi:macrolide transport system ATP-binding/permease protein
MALIECRTIKKYFGDRLILDIDNLTIYPEDRIGIIGANGVGKTTLINILSQRLEPDEGWVRLYGKYSYISQLEEAKSRRISDEMASKFEVESVWNETMSGGEKTRFKIAESLSKGSLLIFADEPTSNVDMEGIELIEKGFEEYKGAMVLISHDRSFLDKLCNKILEIEDGKIKIYNGNYSNYATQKTHERARAQFEYEEYITEKKRLEGVIHETNQKVKSMRNTPKRMGNSEARLHKKGNQKAKANLEKAVKHVENRIDQLEIKEKPKQQERIKFDVMDSTKLHSRIIIEGQKITKIFGDKIILKDADFHIDNGSKIALIGPNGCGKTTLIKLIINRDDSIKIAQGAKIGYFSQDMSILDDNLTILENIMKTSIYHETFARILLARLLLKREDVYKKINVLSGGEQVKVSFAKILLQEINLLILDEPTNYLDINSLEVIEEALRDYDRTLLFVSHDRRFISSVADHIMTIENHGITMFQGSYDEYLADRRNKCLVDDNQADTKNQIYILQNRLSEVIGKLSMPLKKDELPLLDKEYYELLDELKRLKDRL